LCISSPRATSLPYTTLFRSPETKDNNFTWKDFQTKNNSELVGIFGNFINRVAVLIHKYYNGVIPDGKLGETEQQEIKKAGSEIEDRKSTRLNSSHVKISYAV